jgi:hypothetical protein
MTYAAIWFLLILPVAFSAFVRSMAGE